MSLLALLGLGLLAVGHVSSQAVVVADGGIASDDQPDWACDVRVWSRAPDLYPGAHLPADARLSLNGSACLDVVKWEVGLRYMERAVIKKKAENAALPVRPERPRYNSSTRIRPDFDDIFGTGWRVGMRLADAEYEKALSDYETQIRNESFWFVKGQYSTVFNVKKEMPLPMEIGEYTDLTEGFAIHVPATNFPPVERTDRSGVFRFGQADGEMVNTETTSEHYHLVHLRNGTVLDLPSGLSGFKAAPAPSSPEGQSGIPIPAELTWPVNMDLISPRVDAPEPENVEDRDFRIEHRRAPKCDAGNRANFSISVKSNITQPVVGRNMTFEITIKRTGNGSEFPAFLDLGHKTDRNLTWAWKFVANETEYNNLTGQDPFKMSYGDHGKTHVLGLPSAEYLIKRQKEAQAEAEGCHVSCWSGGSGFPHHLESGFTRHEIFGQDEAPIDEYTFAVEVAIKQDEYPSFVKTFETLRSLLVLDLHTYFTCDLAPASPVPLDEGTGDSNMRNAGLGFTAEDEEWREYKLPVKKPKKRIDSSRIGRSLRHGTSIPLNVRLQENSDIKTKEVVLHYLDPAALGPVLSDRVSDAVKFPLLDREVIDETKEQLKRQRWRTMWGSAPGWCGRHRGSRNCFEANGGGRGWHAASLWQTKLEKQKERETRGKTEEVAKLVIQA